MISPCRGSNCRPTDEEGDIEVYDKQTPPVTNHPIIKDKGVECIKSVFKVKIKVTVVS